MSRAKTPRLIDIDKKDVEQMLSRAKAALSASDSELIEGISSSFAWLIDLIRSRRTTLAKLRQLVGVSGSKKPAEVGEGEGQPAPENGAGEEAKGNGGATPPLVGDKEAEKGEGGVAGSGEGATPPKPADTTEAKPEKKEVKGHGRVPASKYRAATHIAVPHESLRVGGPCPDGCKGRLYRLPDPALFLRIFGQAPLSATCWDCERLRCNACNKVFTARAPEEAQGDKYDETAASMIALLHYGAGMPFHRLAELQRTLETPVPVSTQWDVVEESVPPARCVHGELVKLAAQGSVLHNDDSHMDILEFMGKRRAKLLAKGELSDPERTGLVTTAIVSIDKGRRPDIVLFMTGRKHAGENLGSVLDHRNAGLPVPKLMSDALARNVPEGHEVLEGNCLSHWFRKILDERDNYPIECQELLEKIGLVYKVDDRCRKEKLSAEERLLVHQRDSTKVMTELKESMEKKLADKQVEPNSGLGQAFNYLLKRWDKFTLFLREPGAPLDNNICERALKMAITHRNNSRFYRSQRGAEVGDIYMSLIYTAKLCGENPFHYLTALHRHAKVVADKPAEWLPWNYKDTLARMGVKEALRPGSSHPAATAPKAHSPALTPPLAA